MVTFVHPKKKGVLTDKDRSGCWVGNERRENIFPSFWLSVRKFVLSLQPVGDGGKQKPAGNGRHRILKGSAKFIEVL